MPLHLALFLLGGVVTIGAWSAIDLRQLPPTFRRTDRLMGSLVLPLAAFLVFLPALLAALSDKPTEPAYLQGPTFFWIIALLAMVAACVALRHAATRGSASLKDATRWTGRLISDRKLVARSARRARCR